MLQGRDDEDPHVRIHEPRASWTWMLWLGAAVFAGVPLLLLTQVASPGGPPALLLFAFPLAVAAVLVLVTRTSQRPGFTLAADGIHGGHAAGGRVLPWADVSEVAWRYAQDTGSADARGDRAPEGYAVHAILHDGGEVRLMDRVASRYGQQQDINEQLAAARGARVLPVGLDARIPTHDDGAWSGTPPSPGLTHWTGQELPSA